jgi:hypothetical protein
MNRSWALAAAISLGACAASTPAPPPSDRPAPFPYTPEQIRDATQVGRTYLFGIQEAGKDPLRSRMRFTSVSPERAVVESEILDSAGNVVGPARTSTSTWAELQAHATFPGQGTTITEEEVETPGGTFLCMKYHVVDPQPDGTVVTIAHFAKDLPGPPVKMHREKNGQHVMSMLLLAHQPGR